jgi:sporulation protein YlmC with PRC-barrel domain
MVRLGRDVLDKEILDRAGFKGGKVDDLLLAWRDDERPVVHAMINRNGASAALLGSRVGWLAGRFRRAVLGFGDEVTPIVIGWEHVTKIDVTVHIDLDREQIGLLQAERAIWERWISHLPGARR